MQIQARHCHERGFAAVVLTGRYVEAGDEGRSVAEPGAVLIHHPFDAHFGRVAAVGAEVLVLPISGAAFEHAVYEAGDVDAVVRAFERSAQDAVATLVEDIRPMAAAYDDWPDLLAQRLRTAPDTAIGDWARCAGLRAETVSRGFRQVFGVSAAAYRATARTRAALTRIRGTSDGFADIAAGLGFADQAHLTRSIRRLTGRPPSAWRRPRSAAEVKSVQDAALSAP